VDDNMHGTHVAGTISARANNDVGVAGVDPGAGFAICKALRTAAGTGLTSDVANCINWTHTSGAKVISMSLGGGESTTLRNAVLNAWKGGAANGSVLIAAAGNDGDATLNYPAAYAEVVSVAATDHNDARVSFSSVNPDVEIAPPGVSVLSTIPGGQYARLPGTSMATPHVSGVAGVLWQLFPGDTAAGIRGRLSAAVDDKGAPGRDSSTRCRRVAARTAPLESAAALSAPRVAAATARGSRGMSPGVSGAARRPVPRAAAPAARHPSRRPPGA
jgi:thermitase